ncbi:hypothetical protein TNCV_244791 [Trichonephila clavipes]|uniref:Uncharacterized protein n=1 Tax=Trichonephila clavipes TaxID=2585209 RepID=A0A8X6V6G1_TRICX|nr:hypothetical protein TNCV_244791 [Trichonephila clavipes]
MTLINTQNIANKNSRKKFNLTEEELKEQFYNGVHPIFQSFLEKSASVIDRYVIEFSSNFQKHPHGHQFSKNGHQKDAKLAESPNFHCNNIIMTATAGSDVVQSGHPIFDDIFQHLWPYIGNNMANVVFQMVKRLWLIRIDQ